MKYGAQQCNAFCGGLFFRRFASTHPCEQLLVELRGLPLRVLRFTRSLDERPAAARQIKVVAAALAAKIACTSGPCRLAACAGRSPALPVAGSGNLNLGNDRAMRVHRGDADQGGETSADPHQPRGVPTVRQRRKPSSTDVLTLLDSRGHDKLWLCRYR